MKSSPCFNHQVHGSEIVLCNAYSIFYGTRKGCRHHYLSQNFHCWAKYLFLSTSAQYIFPHILLLPMSHKNCSMYYLVYVNKTLLKGRSRCPKVNGLRFCREMCSTISCLSLLVWTFRINIEHCWDLHFKHQQHLHKFVFKLTPHRSQEHSRYW